MNEEATSTPSPECTTATWQRIAQSAGERFHGLRNDAASRTREAIRSADGAVHHRPYAAMAAVALAGLIAGLMIARR